MNTKQAQTQTLSSRSGGLVGKKEWTVVMRERKEEEKESWPLIKRVFTEAQRKELHEQAVINRHISAGLPVPLHLVLPIWKSVVSSLAPISIYKQYPSFLGHILQGFDCRNMMDSEPGRCRRTDGKKWRCSRNVLSDQKYCERHIHRGRQRSRKLVEASEFASPSATKISEKPKPEQEPPRRPTPNPSSVSVGLQLMTPSSNVGNAGPASSFSNKRVCRAAPPFSHALVGTTSADTVFSGSKINQSSTQKSNIAVCRNMSRGLEFSPRSVLQGRAGLYLGNGTQYTALESGRCRRTDGKKWRCRRDVVPDQKYCPSHMHRGVKRLGQSFEPAASSAASSAAPARPASSTARGAAPNTNLCISIPMSPPPISHEEERSSSSTSSDTTITDTSN